MNPHVTQVQAPLARLPISEAGDCRPPTSGVQARLLELGEQSLYRLDDFAVGLTPGAIKRLLTAASAALPPQLRLDFLSHVRARIPRQGLSWPHRSKNASAARAGASASPGCPILDNNCASAVRDEANVYPSLDPNDRYALASSLTTLAQLLSRMGRPGEAEAPARAALAFFERWGHDIPVTLPRNASSDVRRCLQGAIAEGRAALGRRLPIYRAWGQADREIIESIERLLAEFK